MEAAPRPPSVREGFGLLLVSWAAFFAGTIALSGRGKVSAFSAVILEAGGILLPAVLWASLRGLPLFPARIGPARTLAQIPLLGIAGPLAAFGLVGLIQSLGGTSGDDVEQAAWLLAYPLWVQLGLFALLPAVCEELLFRGAFLACLRGWPETAACAASAATFALFHGSLSRFLPVAALGYALALVVRRSGSLGSAIVVHAAHNAAVLILLPLDVTRIPPALDGAALALGVFLFAFAQWINDRKREGRESRLFANREVSESRDGEDRS